MSRDYRIGDVFILSHGIVTISRGAIGRAILLGPLKVDPFLLVLVAAVALAVVLPVRGEGARIYARLTDGAIALLFLSQGMKLSRRAVLDGAGHWRLHLVVLGATFVMFPVLGFALSTAAAMILPVQLASGMLYLSLLPSTVQSSIAFTAIARGNVAAAVCSASLSNLLGVVVTSLLVASLMRAGGGIHVSWASIGSLLTTILLPFVVGHLSRPWSAAFVGHHRRWIGGIDRGSIILVVYGAFSESVTAHFWSSIDMLDLFLVLVLCSVLLSVALVATMLAARAGGFDRADKIAIIFCGSKKSLASGVPIASALFPAAMVGGIIVPLMIFHQLQLFACSVLARRFERSLHDVLPMEQLGTITSKGSGTTR